ncbi:hypothetical protein DQM68_16710 [Leptospira mayottensis]|nr:hypothetical protein DQM68_16710 [Leptospira mayottensis]AZQ01491.1 hypothetical protein LEP1GSC190_04995 [Leptospira mayottensis 200901116]
MKEQGSGDGTKEIARRRGSGIPSLETQLDICKLERQQARYEARGRLSPSPSVLSLLSSVL